MNNTNQTKAKPSKKATFNREAALKTARNNAVMVAVMSAGGSAGGGVLLGGALAGPFGAVAGGIIGATAAYFAFRDAGSENRSPAKSLEKTDRAVENH